MKERLGFAVIGCGRFGSRRISTVVDNPESDLVCIVDIDGDKAKEFAQKFGCDYYTDYREAIKRSDVECLIVAVPNKYHAPIAIDALKAGKHVFCEKPLARNSEEALAIVREALNQKVFLKTGSNLRYFPNIQKAKRLLDEKAVGDLLFFRGRIGNAGKHLSGTWYTDPDKIGGGTLLDNGCHLLDLIRWFMGEVHECQGTIATLKWSNIPLEDNAVCIFKTIDGKMAYMQSSWTEWVEYAYIEVYGTEGFLRIDCRIPNCITVHGHTDGTQEIYDYSTLPPQSYSAELEAYVQAIKNGQQPLPSGYDGMRAVQMVDGIYESSRKGEIVTVYGEMERKIAKTFE